MSSYTKEGLLITFEGLDGSGKSTMVEMLQDELADEFNFTREPTNSRYGDAVYESIADPDADEMAELFLYVADHAAHLDNVISESETNIISDRYIDSRIAYQGTTLANRFGGLSNAIEFVKNIHEPWTIYPDLTIYLDVDAETAYERSGATNKFEQISHLTTVRKAYQQIISCDKDRFSIIDATRPKDAVYADILDVIRQVSTN